MAGEVLRTATELLADFPDNSAGLIEAVDSRNFVVSVTNAVGFAEPDAGDVPFTIPLVADTPVDFLNAAPPPAFAGNFWVLDGNNRFVPNYTPLGITVPAGTTRLVAGRVTLVVEKDGNATPEPYEFVGTENGVLTGNPVTVQIPGGSETVEVLGGTRLYDVAAAGAISFLVTAVGHANDLIVHNYRVTVEGVLI